MLFYMGEVLGFSVQFTDFPQVRKHKFNTVNTCSILINDDFEYCSMHVVYIIPTMCLMVFLLALCREVRESSSVWSVWRRFRRR